jgi:uncharacterized protein YlbG (UPF0298 family)
MGEFFRSAQMQFIQLFVQFDAAHDTIEELGDLNCIEFVDVSGDEKSRVAVFFFFLCLLLVGVG